MLVTILGGNSLLGRHLIASAYDPEFGCKLNVWNMQSEEEASGLPNNNPNDRVEIHNFEGMDALDSAIRGASVVINAYENVDFSCSPHIEYLDAVNYQFVDLVLKACQVESVDKLIQLSSIYLQCTPMWPNINSREVAFTKDSSVPFKAYVQSKSKAENLLSKQDKMKVIIARVGCLYGEEDTCSPICDAVYASKYMGYLPVYGDCGGVFQMSYAGNVAYNLMQLAQKLDQGLDIGCETVTIMDDTPNQDIYSTTLAPLVDAPLGIRQIPFFLFFPFLMLAAFVSRVFNRLGVKTMLDDLPDPVYVYFLFRHWTFLSNFKQLVYFGLKPKYSYKESIERCSNYYKNLDVEDVAAPSWRSM